MTTVYIGSDHRGVKLAHQIAEYLKSLDYVKNVNIDAIPNATSSDYPLVANQVCYQLTKELYDKQDVKGILVCGSGIGMSIAANRHKGIRCVLARDPIDAQLGRQHNNCNVISLGADFNPGLDAISIIEKFLETKFEPVERYQRRVEQMDQD